ncbi:YwmB family TATA-box binding protein [Aeribacillus alveayuensis]|uniref:TATA-box binding protein n=1 Tax=Aeribacillus alveayuensis TaxID=279215 RepID=A0ABT9VP38_9BACI|nr:hypothetical protein [Bacillus alveayuensis]
MKKKSVIAYLFMIVLTIIIMGKETMIGAMSDETNVKKIVEGLQSENIEVDEWSLYVKHPLTVDSENIPNEVKRLQREFRQFIWVEERKGDVIKWIGKHKHKGLHMNETLQIVTTRINHHSQSYILYQASIKGWHEKNWGEINHYFKNEILSKFKGNYTIFTCVKGYTSDKMKSVLHLKADRILDKFRAKSIESLTESDFISISGYTPKWDSTIPTKNGNMNIQIALRSAGLGGKTTVIVGTPIITTEY